MGNQRWQKHTAKGHKDQHSGPRKDSVDPIKTRNWADVPGKTSGKDRSHGFRHVKQGLASKGI